MRTNPQETADLVTFTEEILNRKLHFLCCECLPLTILYRIGFRLNFYNLDLEEITKNRSSKYFNFLSHAQYQIQPLNINFDGIRIKQYSKVNYLRCGLDEAVSGGNGNMWLLKLSANLSYDLRYS